MDGTMKRRGLIAGAAALVAGALAKRTAESVAAGNDAYFHANVPQSGAAFSNNPGYDFGGDFYGVLEGAHGNTANGYGVWGEATGTGIGVFATAKGGLALSATSTGNVAILGNSTGANPAVKGLSDGGDIGIGVAGDTTASTGIAVLGGRKGGAVFNGGGVRGLSDGGYGVEGISGNVGVRGECTGDYYGVYGTAGNGGYAVYGTGNGAVGVYGNSSGNAGVQGASNSYYAGVLISTSNHGLYGGTNASATSGKAGVYGAGGQFGVWGKGSAGIGVYGTSASSYGVLGVSSAGGAYSGITGSVFTGSGAAFAGGASNSSAYAAYFTGKVNIDGPFLVNGTQRFTLKHTDGTSRLVASIQSPEPWIEDVGKGALAGGSATVALDADFREVAETGDYHVFLTEYGDSGGLYVATQNATGFTVRARGAASGTFSWRVVAKPKDGGGKIARMAKYEQPNIKIPGINGEPLPPMTADEPTLRVPPEPPAAQAAPPSTSASPPAPAPQPAPPPRTAPAGAAPVASATTAPRTAPATAGPAPAAVQPTTAPAAPSVAPPSSTPQAAPAPRT